jgi:hypothetical protein
MYITATDKFFSQHLGKISKLVYVCETSNDMDKVMAMISDRKDLKYITPRTTKPRWSSKYYDISWRDTAGNKISEPK